MFVWRTGSSWGGRVDGYCDRLTPVSIWSLRSLRKKKFSDHTETTLQRSQRQRSLRSNFLHLSDCCPCDRYDRWRVVSYDRYDRRDRWSFFFFFFFAIAAITVMGAIMWKPGFNLIMAYFKRKNCLQRNLYLNCVSLWKSLNIVWSVSISAVIWSSLLISVTWVELLWAVYKFFRINNIVPKISQVMMKRRPEVHISIDLQLCRFTLWHNGRRNFWKMNVLKDSANTDR